VKYIDLILC